jgi:hypothetical protein
VLHSVSERGSELLPIPADAGTVEDRVVAIIDLVWEALDKPSMRALTNLRLVLPRRNAELENEYPLTTAALEAWDRRWERACREAFNGLDVDPARLRRVRRLLPSAVRGLHAERALTTTRDLNDARKGLAEAITLYLS